jgi:hypothetical protein
VVTAERCREEQMSVKKILIRGFLVVMVVATAGLSGAVIGGTSSANPKVGTAPAEATAKPLVVFPDNESLVRDAILTVCGGRTLIGALSAQDRDHVDQLLADRARHAAGLAGNPLTSGTGTAAGVDDALHIQMLDRDVAAVLCPVAN